MGETAKPRTWWMRLAIAGAVVVALVCVALTAFVVTGWVRESRAIDAVRALGHPLTPADIVFPAGAAESDLRERVQRFSTAIDTSPSFVLGDASDRAETMAELRAAPAWSALVEPVEQLFACLGDDERSAGDIADAIEALLADPRRKRELEPCELQFLRARAAWNEPLLELVRDVCRAAPDSGERATREWTPMHGAGLLSDGTPVRLFVAVRALREVAVARAAEGRTAESLEALDLAFRGAGLMRGWPSLFGNMTVNAARSQALDALHAIMPLLPPDADLSRIDAELAVMDPPAELERAFLCERAFGNELFAALREGRLTDAAESWGVPTGVFDVLVWALVGHDRTAYLETMGRAAFWSRRPYAEVEARVEEVESRLSNSLAAKTSILTRLLVPRISAQLRAAAAGQARIGLARAAIRARAEGADAALRAAASSVDPFRPGFLQSRLETDGTLVLWSVGMNGIDDGGRDEPYAESDERWSGSDPPDIVWCVVPR